MATEVKMPKLGLTMTEGTIMKWLKKEGEHVQKGDALFELQSDKSNIEEESPASGILRKIIFPEGSVVPCTETVAIIGEAGEAIPDTASPNAADEKILIKASPAAKKIAGENNIDLSEIVGTGPGGRIVEKDVLSYTQELKIKATPVAKKIAKDLKIDLESIQKAPGERITKADLINEQVQEANYDIADTIPVMGMRKVIAERMSRSKSEVPHIYLTLSVDMTKVIELRQRLMEDVEKHYGTKLSYTDILIKTAAVALKQNPNVNSSFAGETIAIKQNIDVGFAVALDDGLMVPIVRDADKKGIGVISKDTTELIKRTKQGDLLPNDYQGGTFTITNLGMYDIEHFSAIINQPESAILAIGKIVKKPVVQGNEIVILPMMSMTLSCDHRVIDGALGARFLQRIKQILEDPVAMLI